jgi:glycosyltransferase involved in cell wall biosynthesis
MPGICIGVHVHAEPQRLRATLESVRAHTGRVVELLLLPDGPDDATRVALAALSDLPQLGSGLPLGPPACFNRLAAATRAEIVVLLESGAQVGPGWLDYLLAALEAGPRHGLAGPSTNLAWNEQAAFPLASASPAEIARTAQAAARRFGAAWQTLEPLHSLADFCYVVRREVIEAVGAADEAYGPGPCWEMDYNVRAARAGFRGVWACAAYVHRAPFTARRQREEAARFEANKRRYQDKFCSLRLRGERPGYEPHCRGEACEHFAPLDLIQIGLPLARGDQPPSGRPAPVDAGPYPPAADRLTGAAPAMPLVSCIMPTCGRAAFVRQAIDYFQRQDYPTRELIIVDDGPEDSAGLLPADTRIRYLRLPQRQSIGAKRNLACRMARGEIIAQWDDDDWYAPTRLSAQAGPLLTGQADLCGLTADLFFDLPRWAFWRCTPALHRRLFVADVHGGTLVFQRRVWERLAQYPDASLAEDAAFLNAALRRGARLCRLPGQDLFLYVRHDHNAWAFACGQYLDPRGWQRAAEPALPTADRAFYAASSPASGGGRAPAAQLEPRITCIMPTANRRRYVPRAIRYFLRQDYPNRELIVVDDGGEAVADLVPADARIRYLRLDRPRSLGAKRNLACDAASGDLIAHWDDDDWMAPWRLSYQAQQLLAADAQVCGVDQLLCLAERGDAAWQYVYPRGRPPWVAGGTLCYARSFWQTHPFPELSVGEDNHFVWSSRAQDVLALADCTFYVALLHSGNTSPKLTHLPPWQPYPPAAIRDLLGDDWGEYAIDK